MDVGFKSAWPGSACNGKGKTRVETLIYVTFIIHRTVCKFRLRFRHFAGTEGKVKTVKTLTTAPASFHAALSPFRVLADGDKQPFCTLTPTDGQFRLAN